MRSKNIRYFAAMCLLPCLLFKLTSAQTPIPTKDSTDITKDSAIIIGKVVSVSSTGDSAASLKYLYLNNQQGNENVTVQISGDALQMTWEELLSLSGQYLQVSGTSSIVNGARRILIRDRKQIKILYQTLNINKGENWFTSWGPQLISVVLGAIIGVLLIPFAERLKRKSDAANITFTFEDDQYLGDRAQHIWVTPEKDADNVYQNRYIQVGVYNDSKRTAKECTAVLTKIQKEENSGPVTLFSQAFPLAWAYIGAKPMDIVKGTTLFLSLTTVDPIKRFLQPQTLLEPLLYSSLLNSTGIYTFSILVVGGNCQPITADIIVEVGPKTTEDGKVTEFYPRSVSIERHDSYS